MFPTPGNVHVSLSTCSPAAAANDVIFSNEDSEVVDSAEEDDLNTDQEMFA
jgi:hypothetical protein